MGFVPHSDVLLHIAIDVMEIHAPPLSTDQTIAMWNTIGVWVAGIATFLAVCVAIGVPAIQGYLLRRQRRMQEWQATRIMAIEMNVAIGGLLSQILDRRPLIASAVSGIFNGNAAFFGLNAQLWAEFPPGSDLANLPYPIGPSVAALRASVTIYNGLIERAVGLIHIKTLDSSLKELKIARALDSTQAALARAAGHLGKYEPAYGLVNYFNNGSGGNIDPLPDYV